jgi:hypothetical protein
MPLPLNGWLRGLSYELVDGNGRRLPTHLLHHLNLIAPEHRELFSPIMLRVGAAGPETKPWAMPFFLGYRVRPGDTLLVKVMMHNPTPTAFDGVRLRVRLEYTPATGGPHPISIQPVYLDVMPPAGAHSFDLPPGRSSMSWEGRPAIGARLLAAGGHMHRYGKALRLEDVSTGDLIWEARPQVDSRGEVTGMPIRYFLPFGVALDPDHVYRLTAVYDNPTGEVIPDGGMGALGGIVLPGGGTTWPTVVRSDSAYKKDVHVIIEGEPSHGSGAHRH